MTDKELLSAISYMLDEKLDKKLDEKLEPINVRLEKIEQTQENVNGRLEKIEQTQENVNCQLENVKCRLEKIELMQENDILPRLQNIETCYTDTYRRYSKGIEQLETLQSDVDILKKVVSEHSKRIPQLA